MLQDLSSCSTLPDQPNLTISTSSLGVEGVGNTNRGSALSLGHFTWILYLTLSPAFQVWNSDPHLINEEMEAREQDSNSSLLTLSFVLDPLPLSLNSRDCGF